MLAARKVETLQEWRDRYGPITYLNVFGTSYIYINDYKTITDLFEKRGNIYSSRPKFVMNDLEGWNDWFVVLLPYGPELRSSRQSLHRFLQPSAIPDYFPEQTITAHKLAERLIRSPEDFVEFVRLAAAELIMKVTYGYDVSEKNDHFIGIAEKGVDAFSDAQGFYVVNDVPWLQYLPSWLPGMNFLRIARQGYIDSMNMYRKPYEMVKENLEKGDVYQSLTAKMFEMQKDKNGEVSREGEEFIAKVTGVIYAGGADTTVSSILTFILAMVLYPEVQERAQEELDTVLGKNILPTFEDLPKLKYIDAIRKECLRWQSVVSTPAPHTVSVEDEILGYRIPANSVLMGNIWAILRDPKEYPEPDKFIPERFLPNKGKTLPLEPNKVAFSVGRRICPGRHFAESSIFIDIATILATCKIEKAVDDHGVPIIPKVDYVQQLIRHPTPFKCMIRPRNGEAHSILQQAIEKTNIPKKMSKFAVL
ncbi:cytochrome P450 [Pyrrhoderma noxium]|uniref:Cytochrome P450 n=1 Tax=Pyrrhoderma noxium TaxID=2282107 RepID=A0A286U6X7_9AGAM|nr:cytochrome P450 [Pyrrhoderma noxium]